MKLTFYGATKEVTGSCFLLSTGNYRVLIDCGLIQGPPKQEQRNFQPFPFDPHTLDAVILTHAHLDHSGRLPLLVKNGFKGPIYTHPASCDLCEVMLKDAAFINEKDVEYLNRRRARKHLPPKAALYTIDDVVNTLPYFHGIDYKKPVEILPKIVIQLQDANHILGAAIVEVWVEDKGVSRKLVFSGDLGHGDSPLTVEPTAITEADVLILESTYGDRNHRSYDGTLQELGEVFESAYASKGNILIPAFSVGRTQKLLAIFHQNFKKWNLDRWQIFLDSPMAIEATKIYQKHWKLFTDKQQHQNDILKLANFHACQTPEESMRLNKITSGAIIIAGSGMCEGGRIRHHFKYNIWRENCNVIFIGYQAEGTLGRKLINGADEIILWGERIKVSAKIHSINGFSAHADQSGLLKWLTHFKTSPVIALVHGEEGAMNSFAKKIHQDFTIKPFIPNPGFELDLQKLNKAKNG